MIYIHARFHVPGFMIYIRARLYMLDWDVSMPGSPARLIYIHARFYMSDCCISMPCFMCSSLVTLSPCQVSHARLYDTCIYPCWGFTCQTVWHMYLSMLRFYMPDYCVSAYQASHTRLLKICFHVRFHMVAVARELHTATCGREC